MVPACGVILNHSGLSSTQSQHFAELAVESLRPQGVGNSDVRMSTARDALFCFVSYLSIVHSFERLFGNDDNDDSNDDDVGSLRNY